MQYPIDESVNVGQWVIGGVKSKQRHRGLRRSYKGKGLATCVTPTKKLKGSGL